MAHTLRSVALALLAVAACGKGKSDGGSNAKAIEGTSKAAVDPKGKATEEAVPPAAFVPCDATSLAALATELDKANCLNVDLGDKAITDACEALEKQLTGKTYAFKGCTFSMQGNDEVTFGATGTDKTLGCVMKGGEAGVKDFRDAAMKFESEKLRLDVRGVLAMVGNEPIARLQMTDCQITAHE